MLLPKIPNTKSKIQQRSLPATIGGTSYAHAQEFVLPKSALCKLQGERPRPKLDNRPKFCHRKEQLMMGLCVLLICPCEPSGDVPWLSAYGRLPHSDDFALKVR